MVNSMISMIRLHLVFQAPCLKFLAWQQTIYLQALFNNQFFTIVRVIIKIFRNLHFSRVYLIVRRPQKSGVFA